MQIIKKKINDIKANSYNPNTIPPEKFESLKRAIERFGFLQPILISKDNIIIDGEHRWRACKELGKKEIECVIFESEETALEYKKLITISINNIRGENDFDKFKDLLEDIANAYDTEMISQLSGFSEDYINDTLHLADTQSKEETEDDIPEINKGNIKIKAGDLIELGEHRLLCGNSTIKEDLDKLIQGERFKLIFTSPPYNMEGGLYNSYKDNKDNEDFVTFNINVLINYKRYIASDGFIFWNMSYNKNSGPSFIEVYNRFITGSGLVFLEDIVWDKGHGMPQSKSLTRQYEHILVLNQSIDEVHFVDHIGVFGKKRVPFLKRKKKGITNYWRIDTFRSQQDGFKAAFPVALPERAIEITTEKDDLIVDPFGGSGTSLIAAEKTQRKCCLMEMDPFYCELIIRRWMKYAETTEIKINGVVQNWEE